MQGLSYITESFQQLVTRIRKKFRILDMPLIDITVTLLAVYAISMYFKFSFWYTLVIAFIIMVISHRLFHARTTSDKWLFPSG